MNLNLNLVAIVEKKVNLDASKDLTVVKVEVVVEVLRQGQGAMVMLDISNIKLEKCWANIE